MRIDGKVITVDRRDDIVARFSRPINPGSEIFNKRRQKIGEVSWIFGPVDDPYYEIKINKPRFKRLSISKEELYAEEE